MKHLVPRTYSMNETYAILKLLYAYRQFFTTLARDLGRAHVIIKDFQL